MQWLGRFLSQIAIFSFFIPLVVWGDSTVYGGDTTKPIDVTLSDIFGLTIPFIIAMIPSARDKTFALLVRHRVLMMALFMCVAYFLAIAALTAITEDEFVPVLSAIKLVKILFFVVFGMLATKFLDARSVAKSVLIGSHLVLLALFLSDVFYSPMFPGPRWGSTIMDMDVAGFPNMSATYYAMCGLAVLYLGRAPILSRVSFFYSFLLVVMTVSRASMISMIASLLGVSVYKKNYIMPILVIGCSIVIVALTMNGSIQALGFLEDKFENMAGGDMTAGRPEIWAAAIRSIAENPIFGHGFSPFSNLSIMNKYGTIYSTPHQQYLELFYKSGLLGFALYAFIIYAIFYPIMHCKHFQQRGTPEYRLKITLLAWLILIMVGNFSQPNLSYTCTANLFFFIGGFLVANTSGYLHGAKNEPQPNAALPA